MRFTDNDNFERIFASDIPYGCTAKQLDAYLDCIEKDKTLFDQIRTVSQQKRKPGANFHFAPIGVDDIIENIARSNGIDYGMHSGASFMCLSLMIKEIVDAGGRDAYIASKLDATAPKVMGK